MMLPLGYGIVEDIDVQTFSTRVASAAGIRAAITENRGGIVVLPPGIFLLESDIVLTANDNGTMIIGSGPATILRVAAGRGGGHRGFEITEADGPIQNIRISNLTLDGNKANQNQAYTGFGIFAVRADNSTTGPATGLTIDHVWARNWNTTGFNIFQSNVQLSTVFSESNGQHGIGCREGKGIVINGAVCRNNGAYGLDASQNCGVHVTGLVSTYNGYGVKTTDNCELYLSNAELAYNTNHGLTTTGTGNVCALDMVDAHHNGNTGIRFANDSVRGRFGMVLSHHNTGMGFDMQAAHVTGESISAYNNASYGVYVVNATEMHVGSIDSVSNGNEGLRVTDTSRFSARGGRIVDNKVYGALTGQTASCALDGVRFAAGSNQTTGVLSGDSSRTRLTFCDFTGQTGTKIARTGSGVVTEVDLIGGP